MRRPVLISLWVSSVVVALFAGALIGIGVSAPASRASHGVVAAGVRRDTTPSQSGESPEQRLARLKAWNKTPWALLKADMPSGEHVYRCRISLDDYFNYEYADQRDSMYSIEVCELGSMVPQVHAFISKTARDARALAQALADGQQHTATITIRYDYRTDPSVCTLVHVEGIDERWP